MNIASLKLDHRISPDFVAFAAASNASAPACFQERMTTTICGDRKSTKEKGVWRPVSGTFPDLEETDSRFRCY
jgi:hypothetical protein